MSQLLWRRWFAGLFVLCGFLCGFVSSTIAGSDNMAPKLGVDGNRFTIDGKPAFLLRVSYPNLPAGPKPRPANT